MNQQIHSKSAVKFSKKLNEYLFVPLTQGLIGFSIFFTLILVSKSIGTIFGIVNYFKIEIDDLYLSLFGFLTALLWNLPVRISKNHKTHIRDFFNGE